MADDEYTYPKSRAEQLADRWYPRFIWLSIVGILCFVLVGAFA